MMDERLIYQSGSQCHPQGTQTIIRRKIMAQTKANDLSAIGICYQAQISKVLTGADIRNIAYPKLVCPLGYHVLHQILVLPEPMA
jgi:hypothetical protein